MKKVAVIGLGWLGLPLALALLSRGFRVVGSKTTPDGVEAARMSGIECYPLVLTPELSCEADDLEQLLNVDILVITLPARRSVEGSIDYFNAVQQLVDSAIAFGVPRIIFMSAISVYGDYPGIICESSPLKPCTPSGRVLAELEHWLHKLPNIEVDVLRLAGLVGADRHPGRFLAGKVNVKGAEQGVNLVHLDDVIGAIVLLLKQPKGGAIYNLCAPLHPIKRVFYPMFAKKLALPPPHFATEERQEARLVDGSLICRELGFSYQYPDPMRMPVG